MRPAPPVTALTPADEHDIVSVSTSNVVYHEESVAERSARLQAGRRSGLSMGACRFSNATDRAGFGFFGLVFRLLKWLVVLVIIGVGVMAFRTWTAKRNSKRF